MRADRPQEDHAAFAALFEAHFDALLAYARRRTPQLSDAEDVVAETFTVVWRRLDHLPPRSDAHLPWLYAIARRVLTNYRRGTQRRGRLFERLRRAPVPPPPPQFDVGAALQSLPERDREILRLVAWESLTHTEAGAVLGISANAVAIRVHRARERLRQLKDSASIRTFPGWKGSVKHTKHGDEVT
jgi:DNA-directed RNA polymerase specialized sigma24 family protein